MIYDIRHTTRFDYAGPVRFARCNLRLEPIAWAGQVLECHSLEVRPGGRTATARNSGRLAHVTRVVIGESVRSLEIESIAEVRVDRAVPLILPDDPTIGEVAAEARASRDPCPTGPAEFLYPSPLIPLDAGIGAWCAEELAPDRPVVEACLALARRIQGDFTYQSGSTTVSTTPAEAFALRRGVCQDFAQIMISGLRAAGLSAAYVSGYIRTYPPPGQARLVGADATHAWALVWCGERRGWIGFDPTNGIFMAGDHIVMAIGKDYGDVAPIDGIFLGANAQSITVSVDVAPREAAGGT
ncbi:transglutaminase family protein [Sphingomonas gilva]|uniref:Transglutaminase family protein n=1 Tax=Sphingomonas gilva TaxID=2305907 RepID=A0A396RX96_9SPHN|nr:transglutaminase family protein [Sphingomonas gilva]RHW18341.1 transglutaminase family protein [Sphingomonas gilva]